MAAANTGGRDRGDPVVGVAVAPVKALALTEDTVADHVVDLGEEGTRDGGVKAGGGEVAGNKRPCIAPFFPPPFFSKLNRTC